MRMDDDVSRVARATRAIVRAEDAGRVAEVASVARGRDRRAIDASSGWTRERARAAGRGGRSGGGGDGGSGLRRRRTHRDGRGLQLDGLREGPLGRELDESRPDHARGILRDDGVGGDAGGELAIEGAREGRRPTGVLTRSASTEKKPQRAKEKKRRGTKDRASARGDPISRRLGAIAHLDTHGGVVDRGLARHGGRLGPHESAGICDERGVGPRGKKNECAVLRISLDRGRRKRN